MSISKTIIYSPILELESMLKSKPELNVIDEYGYTPLIQTAIINDINKAQLLLDAGAKIDFTDLTGRTALFWAADNNNLELCELYLKYGANPNAYSNGGQPILVMPLLKQQQAVKKLLLAHGAKLDFAQDFLSAKVLGHSFELEGRIDLVDTHNTFIEVELEGFYLRFTLELITNSLYEFINNYEAKKLELYFPYVKKILRSLEAASKLLHFQHYLIDIQQFLTEINSLLDSSPLILPLSFGGHAITFIKDGEYLMLCDRGAYGQKHGTVIYYHMSHSSRLTHAQCRELLYKRQYEEYINTGLADYLGLEAKLFLKLPVQKTGNCSWANVEAIIPAILFSMLLQERRVKAKATCEELALDFYHKWQKWNKMRSLNFCMQGMSDSQPGRSATKAALLAAIFFQSGDINNTEPSLATNKILAMLTQKQYLPILKCYVQSLKLIPKDNILRQNFLDALEDYGIDIEKLR